MNTAQRHLTFRQSSCTPPLADVGHKEQQCRDRTKPFTLALYLQEIERGPIASGVLDLDILEIVDVMV